MADHEQTLSDKELADQDSIWFDIFLYGVLGLFFLYLWFNYDLSSLGSHGGEGSGMEKCGLYLWRGNHNHLLPGTPVLVGPASASEIAT